MRAFMREFCTNSSIHGIRYFTEERRHWSERCWWAIAICISIYLCGSSIRTYWVNWTESPVTLSLTEKERPISAISFPTIMICPGIKVIKEKLDLVPDFFDLPQENSKNFSDIQLARLDAFALLCNLESDFSASRSKFINNSIYNLIVDMSAAFNETFGLCASPLEEDSICSEIFTPIWTANGFCYAFNALNSNEMYTDAMAPELMISTGNPNVSHWSMDDGYESKTMIENEYPIRVFSGKSTLFVSEIWLFDKDIGSHCGTGTGFMVEFTIPGDSMKVLDLVYIEMDQVANILIKPKLISTSERLRSYSPNQRQCFFNSERRLRFFQFYTQNNCEFECITNFTKQECGCVRYSMPRDKNTKICGLGNVQCYRNSVWKLFGIDVIDGMTDKDARAFREDCNCLPACTTIIYDVEIDKNKYDNELPGGQKTLLTVSFRDAQVITLQRLESNTYTDFLAVCGGLLGLFLGVSLLSIIEFAYYFTLRLFWNIRKSQLENVIVPLTSSYIEPFQRKTNRSIFIDVSNQHIP